MAQFGGNKNPPWAQGGRGGQPGGGAGALDVPGLVGAFGAAAQGPPVFQGNPAGLPPGLAGVGHPLGVQGHGPAVTLAAAMAGQPVSTLLRRPRSFGKLRYFSRKFFSFSFVYIFRCFIFPLFRVFIQELLDPVDFQGRRARPLFSRVNPLPNPR